MTGWELAAICKFGFGRGVMTGSIFASKGASKRRHGKIE